MCPAHVYFSSKLIVGFARGLGGMTSQRIKGDTEVLA